MNRKCWIIKIVDQKNFYKKPNSIYRNQKKKMTNKQTNIHQKLIEACKQIDLNFDLISSLLKNKANPNYKDNFLCNSIYYLCEIVDPDLKCIKYLIENGADPNIQNKNGENSVMKSAELGNYQAVILFIFNYNLQVLFFEIKLKCLIGIDTLFFKISFSFISIILDFLYNRFWKSTFEFEKRR